jgi:DNA-binding MarR family transcriptional regulator
VSSDARAEPDPSAQVREPLPDRLGYLLKHAQLQYAAMSAAILEPYGVTGRELAVLIELAAGEPASQQEAARRLGIDRTTMVALLDALEARGLVERRPHAEDRRRNVVEVTRAGRDALHHANAAAEEAELRFLAPLSAADARRFKDTLRILISQSRSQSG